MDNVEAGRVHAFVLFGMHRGRIGGCLSQLDMS